jgi:flagellar basal body-associated protein FliL
VRWIIRRNIFRKDAERKVKKKRGRVTRSLLTLLVVVLAVIMVGYLVFTWERMRRTVDADVECCIYEASGCELCEADEEWRFEGV